MPLSLALKRQRWVYFCEFEASLVFIASSRTPRTTWKDPVSKNKKEANHRLGEVVVYACNHST